MDTVPNLPKCPVPVLMSYRTYRNVRYRYWCTEINEVSGTGMKVCTGTGGTGIHIIPKLPKCPVPVLMSYRTYQSVPYRYSCRTELTEVCGTGIGVVPNLPKCPVPVLMSYRIYRSVRYRCWCRTELTEASGTGNTGGLPRYVQCRTQLLYAVQNVPFGLWTVTEKKKKWKRSHLELEKRQIICIS